MRTWVSPRSLHLPTSNRYSGCFLTAPSSLHSPTRSPDGSQHSGFPRTTQQTHTKQKLKLSSPRIAAL